MAWCKTDRAEGDKKLWVILLVSRKFTKVWVGSNVSFSAKYKQAPWLRLVAISPVDKSKLKDPNWSKRLCGLMSNNLPQFKQRLKIDWC